MACAWASHVVFQSKLPLGVFPFDVFVSPENLVQNSIPRIEGGKRKECLGQIVKAFIFPSRDKPACAHTKLAISRHAQKRLRCCLSAERYKEVSLPPQPKTLMKACASPRRDYFLGDSLMWRSDGEGIGDAAVHLGLLMRSTYHKHPSLITGLCL